MAETLELTIDEAETYIFDISEKLANDDFSGALESCREVINIGFVDIFSSKMSSQGDPWPEHAPATIARYGEHPLLVLSGDMFSGILDDVVISDRQLTVSANAVYAFAQNFGTLGLGGNIPPREFMFFTETMVDGIVDVVWSYINASIL